MTNPIIETRLNPPDLLQRMAKYPDVLSKEVKATLETANYHVWASVPSYPQKPVGSRYRRTGTLGRSLGISEQGGTFGNPDVLTVKSIGGGKQEARFGTRLIYAPYVIGAKTQARQNRHWYTMETIAKNAEAGIHKLFDGLSKKLVKFLDGK